MIGICFHECVTKIGHFSLKNTESDQISSTKTMKVTNTIAILLTKRAGRIFENREFVFSCYRVHHWKKNVLQKNVFEVF